ncbi:glycosyltransferase [Actinokineospora diospyrosa]|uniref:Glycosyltransferase family 2 protein n=1 Tax=Actinokineospora diospyrosa TaxID=103728 RepID=A0ABT1IMC5_9PSEU|nr:glycosyltransferase family 2 protein [Actinokineospora diospyrosa]MCP2273824.1 hypothetical protein [Actinokineospora diospyrosa]
MIPAWVVAVLVVGVGFTVGTVFGFLRRDREHGSPPLESAERLHTSVAVFVHGGEGPAIAAAERLVSGADIYVADTYVDAARVPVERYDYVLLLDSEHRPHPHYLSRTLPLFEDPDVAAVAGYALLDWAGARRTPLARVLNAYRARALALTQWLLTVARTRPRTDAARLIPSPAPLLRSSVFATLDFNLDLSQQIYRRRLGRVLVVRGALVDVPAPDSLRTYSAQVRLWAQGFWRAAGRNRFPKGVPAFAVETILASVVFLALPVLAITGLITVPALLLGVLLPDVLLTVVVAIRQREARYLPVALLLPFVRFLDAVLVLSALVPRRSAAVAGWVLAVASAVVFVFRVHFMAVRLPVTSLEPSLVDAAYARVAGLPGIPVSFDLWATNFQVVLYGGVSGSFDRYDSVLFSAREAAVAASAVLALCVLLTAALLRLQPLLLTAVLLGCCATAPLFATVEPGGFAAAWVGVGALALVAAITRRDVKPVPVVIIAAGAVVLTALPNPIALAVPGLLVVAMVAIAVVVDRLPQDVRRPGIAVAALAAIAVVALNINTIPPGHPAVAHRAAAEWFATAATDSMDLSAPPLLWADLSRDLADADGRVRRDGPAPLSANGNGLPVATFPGITISLTAGGAGFVGDGNRTVAGVDLGANTRITAPESVRAAFRTGRVDFRVMAVLAEISAQHTITVAEVANPGPEADSELPLRTVVLSAVDGRPVTDPAIVKELQAWLSAQLPPYAPDDARLTDRGFALSWRLSGNPVPN